MATQTLEILSGPDDGFHYDNGGLNTQSTCYFGDDGNLSIAFFRFALTADLTGATITAADFTGYFSEALGVTVDVCAVDSADPTAPSGWADLSTRPVTTAQVEWTTNPTGGGGLRTTPDITSVIQELVDSYTMASGDHIVILMDPRGKTNTTVNEIHSYDGGVNPVAELSITYTPAAPAGDYSRIIDLGLKQNIKRSV